MALALLDFDKARRLTPWGRDQELRLLERKLNEIGGDPELWIRFEARYRATAGRRAEARWRSVSGRRA